VSGSPQPADGSAATAPRVPGATAGRDLDAVIGQRLRRVGQRYTSGRQALVRVLAQAGSPVSIADIAHALPGLPRSSAYRHLVALQAAGAVRRVVANDDFARFELAEELTEHHHHLLCLRCGDVTDITPSPGFEQAVAGHLDDAAAEAGFEAQGHRVDVLGLCAGCRG
jgi:Fur family ferric uptake transcriptional regulator